MSIREEQDKSSKERINKRIGSDAERRPSHSVSCQLLKLIIIGSNDCSADHTRRFISSVGAYTCDAATTF